VFEIYEVRSDGAIRTFLFFAAPKFDCFAEPVIGARSLRVSVAYIDGLRIPGRGCLKSESEIDAAGRNPPHSLGAAGNGCCRGSRHRLCASTSLN
jgi:hypothetical protein